MQTRRPSWEEKNMHSVDSTKSKAASRDPRKVTRQGNALEVRVDKKMAAGSKALPSTHTIFNKKSLRHTTAVSSGAVRQAVGSSARTLQWRPGRLQPSLLKYLRGYEERQSSSKSNAVPVSNNAGHPPPWPWERGSETQAPPLPKL
uniref:Uncharacterized protein n=1 Tax=Trypanosoma congolense (strain IL3000) TaxID=1068625 RepID=G0V1N8_TRYCI|nr:hypothetical protein, unlikely [Trypanosoma congolense IL3000]